MGRGRNREAARQGEIERALRTSSEGGRQSKANPDRSNFSNRVAVGTSSAPRADSQSLG